MTVRERALSGLIFVVDSTHTRSPNLRRMVVLGLVASVLLAGGALLPPSATADGDPASDVLATQPLFLPADAGLTADQQAQLQATLVAARRSGFPLRLAIIAGPGDLGSVTALWHQPAAYARFLDQELSQVFSGPLLVIMPNGLGLAGAGSGRPALRAVLGPSAPHGPMAHSTLAAVRALLAAAGHPVSVSAVGVQQRSGPVDPVAVLVLVAGGLLIVISWGLSLRARPPGLMPRS